MRTERVHSEIVPKRKSIDPHEDPMPAVISRNSTMSRAPSSKERQPESDSTLSVVRLARERNMVAPTEVRLVLKECKEYIKMVKQ